MYELHGLLGFALLPSCRGLELCFCTDGFHSIFRLVIQEDYVVLAHLCAWFGQANSRKGKEKSTGFLFWVIVFLCQSGFACYLCVQVWTEHSEWRFYAAGGPSHAKLHPQRQKKETETRVRTYKYNNIQRRARTNFQKQKRIRRRTRRNIQIQQNIHTPFEQMKNTTKKSEHTTKTQMENPPSPPKRANSQHARKYKPRKNIRAKYAKVVFLRAGLIDQIQLGRNYETRRCRT